MKKRLVSLLLALVLLLLPAPAVMAVGSGQVQLEFNFMYVYPSQNGLMVLDIYSFNNSNTEPFAGNELSDASGNKKTGFLIPLPAGFTLGHNVQGLSAGEYSAVPAGLQVYSPLPPGKTQIEIGYELKQSVPTTITKQIAFPTTELVVDTPKIALTVQSDLVKEKETVLDQGTEYLRYTASGVNANTLLNLTINKSSGGSTGTTTNKVAAGYNAKLHPQGHVALFMSEPLVYTDPHIWAAYLFVMLVLGISALVLWYRVSRNPIIDEDDEDTQESQDQEFLRLKAKQDLLFKKIKELDEKKNAGEINEQEYIDSREKYKQLLVRVKLQLKKLT